MALPVAENTGSQVKRGLVLLLSPVVWTLCFGLLYLLDEAVCGLHFWRWFVWRQVTAVTPPMLLLALLALAVMVGNAFAGWKMWHEAGQAGTDEAAERDRFIGASGLMLSIFFSFLTLGLAAVVIRLHPC